LYQKHLGFALTVVALGLFVPGILLPMFYLSMDMNIAISGADINSSLVNKELSIVNTVTELWEQNRYLVSALIFVFSILIPVIKTSALGYVFFAQSQRIRLQLARFISAIGKWSMADVFVVAVFLAVLSTNHAESAEQHQLSFFGMSIGFEISSRTMSMVGDGFYYFVGYCLLSILGAQLLLSGLKKEITKTKIALD
jgi:uncharacterized paraquat-inducible protein A